MSRRLIVLTGLIFAVAIGHRWIRPADVPPPAPLDGLPTSLGDWRGYPAADFDAATLRVLGVDDHLHRNYVSAAGAQANVYVGYYRSQAQGASIHSPLNCLPGAGWEFVTAERVPFARGSARRAVIRRGSERLLLLYWYQTATRVEGDEYRSMFYTVLDTIEHGRNDAALVRVIVTLPDGPGGESWAARQAADVATRLEPQIRQWLFATTPGAGEGRVALPDGQA